METAIATKGRRATFEEHYATHAPEARRVAFLLVGDRALAEDLVQDAFIRVLGRFGDLRSPESFRSYLMRTVVSLTKNHFRRRALERRHSQSSPLPVSAPHDERDDELMDSLKRLPERQRTAVVLRYCEDLSEHDTAEMMRTSPKAVRSLVGRGLAALRKEVAR